MLHLQLFAVTSTKHSSVIPKLTRTHIASPQVKQMFLRNSTNIWDRCPASFLRNYVSYIFIAIIPIMESYDS